MKPTVVFIRVMGKPLYDSTIKRWLDSYLKFRPTIPHELVVVNRYQDSPDALFDGVASRYLRYDGLGWDCGTWQFAGRTLDSDLLVCFNSSTYLWKAGWLERFVEAAEQYGPHLYGPLSSFEIKPHIRTPCMVFPPAIIRAYPIAIDSRAKTYNFEAFGFPGVENFTLWCRQKGRKTMLVTWDGCYDLPDWRKPSNIYRRGDQSNCLVFDRWCDHYAAADATEKRRLEKLADGIKS